MVKIIGTDSSPSRYFIFCHSVVVLRLSLSRSVFPYLPLYLYLSRPHPHPLLGLLLTVRHYDRTIMITILDFLRTTLFWQLCVSITRLCLISILHKQMLYTPKDCARCCSVHLLQVSLKGKIWTLYPVRHLEYEDSADNSALLTNPPAIWTFAGVYEAVSHDFTEHKHSAPQMFLWITNRHRIHLCVNTLCIPGLEVVSQPPHSLLCLVMNKCFSWD